MFGSSSSLPPVVGGRGGLVCESVGKADLLSDYFESKQSRETVDLPFNCHLSPSLTSFDFRSREVSRLLIVRLGPLWWRLPIGYVSSFLKRTADVVVYSVSVVFLCLVRLSSFPACKSISHSISIVLRCFNVACRFVLDNLWNSVVCFQPPSLLIEKVRVPVMYFCACPIHCKVHWRAGRRLGSRRISAAFKLLGSPIRKFSISSDLCMGIGGDMLSILTQFLSNRSQHVMVDCCRSKLVNVVSGVP